MRSFVLTGGNGLLGQSFFSQLARFQQGDCLRVLIVDVCGSRTPANNIDSPAAHHYGNNVEFSFLRGDLASSDVAAAIKRFAAKKDRDDEGHLSVVHLASVMSGQGETDFEEALRVNLNGKHE